MNHAKKFYLIDASQLKQLHDQQPNVTSGQPKSSSTERNKTFAKRELDSLDSKLLDIINNYTLTPDEKVDQYSKALTEHTIMRQTYTSTPAETTPTVTKQSLYNPLLGISKIYQKKARELLEMLQKSGTLSVSSNGEVAIDNTTLPGSKISDLLNASVNQKAKNREQTTGFADFVNLIDRINVPQTLITKDLKVPQFSQSLYSDSDTEPSSQTRKTPKKKAATKTPKKTQWVAHDKKPWR